MPRELSRRVPLRTCVGCRQVVPARELVRLRAPAGELVSGSGSGRGAWIHGIQGCVALAVQRKGLARALKVALSVDEKSVGRLLSLGGDPPTQA